MKEIIKTFVIGVIFSAPAIGIVYSLIKFEIARKIGWGLILVGLIYLLGWIILHGPWNDN